MQITPSTPESTQGLRMGRFWYPLLQRTPSTPESTRGRGFCVGWFLPPSWRHYQQEQVACYLNQQITPQLTILHCPLIASSISFVNNCRPTNGCIYIYIYKRHTETNSCHSSSMYFDPKESQWNKQNDGQTGASAPKQAQSFQNLEQSKTKKIMVKRKTEIPKWCKTNPGLARKAPIVSKQQNFLPLVSGNERAHKVGPADNAHGLDCHTHQPQRIVHSYILFAWHKVCLLCSERRDGRQNLLWKQRL